MYFLSIIQELLNKKTGQAEKFTPVCIKWQKKLAPVLGKKKFLFYVKFILCYLSTGNSFLYDVCYIFFCMLLLAIFVRLFISFMQSERLN